MRFPTLEVMVRYDIYTVKDLEAFSQGQKSKRDVCILSECKICAFVYKGPTCSNCRV